MKKLVSIVIPCYQEEKNIPIIYNRILKVIDLLTDYSREMIFVNDGSSDSTWSVISNLGGLDDRVKGINLSRNFGHQSALEAGINKCNGDSVIMMDGDGQHPPELINKLIAEWEKGFEIVNTKRIDNNEVSFFKKFTSNLFYSFLNSISKINIDPGSADFRLIDRKVINTIMALPEKNKFFRGLINRVGYRSISIDYLVGKRQFGMTSYTFKKMIDFARIGLTSFSVKPLKLILVIGSMSFVFSVCMTLTMGYVRFFVDATMFTGSAVLAMFVLTNTSFLMILFGVMSLYLVNMFHQIQNRPDYIIAEEINLEILK